MNINPNVNPAWGLAQGDGRIFAESSFTVNSGEMYKLSAHYLCEDEQILIFEMDASFNPNCAPILSSAAESCCQEMKLSVCHSRGVIMEAGTYIVARQTADGEPLAPQSEVRIVRHRLKAGMPVCNSGFCC